MSNRKLGSGVGFGRRTMVVERLEGRLVMAGNVAVSVIGGSLFVTGDNKDNGVLVQQVAVGEYSVTGFDLSNTGQSGFQSGPTKINGSANGTVTVTGVTGDIIIDLKKGNDGLGVGDDVTTLETLAEDCFGFGFGSGSGNGSGTGSGNGSSSGSLSNNAAIVADNGLFTAPRNLIISGGDGNDFIVTNANVTNSEVINAGNGNNGVAVGNVGTSSTAAVQAQQTTTNPDDAQIGNDLVILTGKNNDNVCVDFVTVQGLLNVQTGDGNDTVDENEFDAGHLLLLTAGGNDNVSVTAFDTDREVVVDTGSGNDNVQVSDFSASQGSGPTEEKDGTGSVVVTTDAGNDNLTMVDFEADNLVVDTGLGNDGSSARPEASVKTSLAPIGGPVTIADFTVNHQATIATGSGNDFLDVDSFSAHDLVVDAGAGNDGAEIFNYSIAGNLTAVTGAGNDELYLHGNDNGGTSSVGGNLVADTGAGNDFAEIVDQIIGGNFVVSLGAGNDEADIATSAAAGDVTASFSVAHNFVLDAGAGNDSVDIGEMQVGNDMVLALGAGNDEMSVDGVTVGGNAVLDAGAGNDGVSITNTSVAKNATLLMGAGNDTLTLGDDTVTGKATLDGGAGKNDTLNDNGGNTFGSEFDNGFEHKNV